MIRPRTLAMAAAGLALLLAPALAAAATLAGGAPSGAIAGLPPQYGPGRVAAVPNAAAIVRRIWVPRLDDGFNPQGLTIAGGSVLVAGYRSREFSRHRGPCRVFRLDPASGALTGNFAVPPPCGHAGGLAYDGAGTLYLADTRTLFAVALSRAFAGPMPPVRRHPLGPGLTGALAASAPGAIWLGTYREDRDGRLFRFAAPILAELPDRAPLTVAAASAVLTIPRYAQGAAIDRDGRLWLARSTSRWGELDRLDPESGRVLRDYRTAPGVEGIAFDGSGRLWAVSEAGARHFYDHFLAAWVTPFYPLVFALDPARLE